MSLDSTRPADDASPEAPSRRSFLSWSVAAGSIAVPAAALVSARPALAAGKKKSNLGKKLPELYSRWDERNFKEIQADENTHVDTIAKALGANARPKPTFQNLEASSYHEFAVMAQTFENTGVGAYLGALPYILDKTLLSEAGSIALVEAYHSGFLNTLLNSTIVPEGSAFASPLTIDEVVTAVTPFISSLNGGPTPTFSTSPSAGNDLAILDTALLLEYLEAEFYNVNVPKFFG